MSDKPVVLPDLGAPTADTHAHLDMLEDPTRALADAALAGLAFVATVADVTEDAERTYESLPQWLSDAEALLRDERGDAAPAPPRVGVIVGCHPHNAKDFDEAAERLMIRLATHPLTVGLGELGLDYHYDHSPRDVQRDVFARHLRMARELDRPVTIHLREAHDDGFAILAREGLPEAGAILHCFTEDAAVAERFVGLGCYVSFAGPVTFGKGDAIREAAAAVPLDRILVETDCPFMAPAPYRGRTNEPAWSVLNAARIAEVRGIPCDELARATLDNTRRVFRLTEV